MVNGMKQTDRSTSPESLSRRRALTSLVAFAAGSGSMSSRAQVAANWPLWTIEAKGGKVYLTGETPARPTAWKDDRIERLVATCSAFWTETNQTQHQDSQALIQRFGMDGTTPLFSKLTEADRRRVAQVAAMAKTPLNSLASFRPWLAAFALEQAYYGAMNFPESGTAEKVLLPKAESAGLALASEFATQGDVITFMGGMSPLEDLQYLHYTLDHILDGTASNERIYSLWSRGDMSGAERMVERMRNDQPDVYRKHVVGRNKRWVPRINAMLDASKPALVVVGLYHVEGPDSVLVQLRSQGFTVRAV